jgi:hypothetical protein
MFQYSHAIQKYNDIGIKDQPIKIIRGGTPINIYKCQMVQMRITIRLVVRKNLIFSITSWFKGGVAIITMDKFTIVTKGKQQPQTQHNGNLCHTTRSMLQVKCNIGYGNTKNKTN